MKYILYFIVLVTLFSSCTKTFLDEQDPNRVTTANFWKTEGDLKSALGTAYWAATSEWGYYGYGISFYTEESRAENYYLPVVPGWDYDITIYQNDPNNDGANQSFTIQYRGINFANQVIQYGGAMSVDQAIKDKYIPEAYFLRGLFYFALVNDWGSVPIHASVVESKDAYNIERSPIEEVWKQVENDFAEAAKNLPATRPGSEAGRATKGAALAYQGRALLYQGKWAEAQTVLKGIVDNAASYGYDLEPEYQNLFDGNHENGPESVFEIERNNTGGSNLWTDRGNDMVTTTLRAIYCAPAATGGWDGMYPTKAYVDSFLVEPTATGGIDPRAEATVAWDHYPKNPDYMFYQRNFHDTWGPNVFYNKKYENWWNSSEGEGRSTLDDYGMRYDDVLLMLAEAYTMQNNIAAAAPLVKRIRDRAKLADKNFSGYNQGQMMKEIRTQRNLEFGYENLHFYDMRRWGLLEKAIKDSKKQGYENYSSKYEYYPIPSNEMKNNNKITQNDAWK